VTLSFFDAVLYPLNAAAARLSVLIPPVLAVCTAVWLVGVVRSYAIRTALLDVPNDRSSHTQPTPRGGGLGILGAAAIGLLAALAMGHVGLRLTSLIASGVLVLGLVGWIDDRRGLSSWARLAIHVLLAAVTVYVLGGLPELRIGHHSIPLGILGGFMAVIGIVWSINLFNFMDGIDGLAGSEALLVFGIVSALSFYVGDTALAVTSSVFAAAAAGFLIWNWPPARIFMGDVGSGPLGYAVAAMAVASEAKRSVPLIAFALLGGVFVFDATVTLIRRVLRGRRLSEAHRDHAYQRLSRAWGSHRSVTMAAGAVTIVLSVLAIGATLRPAFAGPALVIAALVLSGVMIAVERRSPM
jgi:Fuc2NAc and GlcNAc transferase